MKHLISAAVAAAFLLPSAAFAQSSTSTKSKARSPRGTMTLAEVIITGRIQRPIAAVDVSRIRPTLTLSVLSQPFLMRIGSAIYKDPF